jgi:hypothetical protein
VRVKEPGLQRLLVADPHPRHSFVTYFSTVQSAEQLLAVDSTEAHFNYRDWGQMANDIRIKDQSVGAVIRHDCFTLSKGLSLKDSRLVLNLEFNTPLPTDAGLFFVELNLTALTDQADDRFLLLNGQRNPLNEGIEADGITEVSLVDEWQQRRCVIAVSRPARLITYPVYTVTSSEGGFERTYQGTCLMFGFEPAGLSAVELDLYIEAL